MVKCDAVLFLVPPQLQRPGEYTRACNVSLPLSSMAPDTLHNDLSLPYVGVSSWALPVAC